MIGGSNPAAELASLDPWPDIVPAITSDERRERIERARERVEALSAQALFVAAGPSLHYFTGISWAATERLVAMLLPVTGVPMILCPRFELDCLAAVMSIDANVLCWEEDEDPIALILGSLGLNATLAIDPLLPFMVVRRLAAEATLIDGAPAIDNLRSLKSAAELALLGRAKLITLEAQRRAARILTPGILASEVASFIDAAHRAMGASGSAFCAVQFGKATAFPHGIPGDHRLAEDQLVLIDTGCTLDGYHSDITPTYAFGRVEDDVRRLWDVEHDAQAAAFAAVRPGVPCSAADDAARVVLERAGLGPDYRLPGLPHRTGHGIGLSIHEPPYLVRGESTPFEPACVFPTSL